MLRSSGPPPIAAVRCRSMWQHLFGIDVLRNPCLLFLLGCSLSSCAGIPPNRCISPIVQDGGTWYALQAAPIQAKAMLDQIPKSKLTDGPSTRFDWYISDTGEFRVYAGSGGAYEFYDFKQTEDQYQISEPGLIMCGD
jgi:hypothetical protein